MSRELDAEVAEKVMGWVKGPEKHQYDDLYDCHWLYPNGDPTGWYWGCSNSCFKPSTSISDAWRVVEEMGKRQLDVSIDKSWCTGYLVQFTNEPFGGPKELRVYGQGRADTAPEAICRAALEAVK
jgi:hypothetical protein